MTTDVGTGRAVRRYPFSRAHALDMDPTYRGLRDDEPMSRIQAPFGGECWLAVRHADVRTVLSDPRFSRAATVGEDVPRPRPEIDHQTSSILNMDPPEHTRLRKLVARAFTARRVADLRPRTVDLTRGLLDDLRAAGIARRPRRARVDAAAGDDHLRDAGCAGLRALGVPGRGRRGPVDDVDDARGARRRPRRDARVHGAADRRAPGRARRRPADRARAGARLGGPAQRGRAASRWASAS